MLENATLESKVRKGLVTQVVSATCGVVSLSLLFSEMFGEKMIIFHDIQPSR